MPQHAAAAAQAGLLSTSANMSAPAEITTLAYVNLPTETGIHQPSLFKILMQDLQSLCGGDLWWRKFCQQKEQKIEAEAQVQELQPHLRSGERSDFPAAHASSLCDLSTDSMVVQILVHEDSLIALNETACIQGGIFMI